MSFVHLIPEKVFELIPSKKANETANLLFCLLLMKLI